MNRALAEEINKSGVEIRLYKIIYRLVEDLENIGASMVAAGEEELVLGRAKVIALFKSRRKGIILGCEVQEGRIALGDRFRVIGAMGPKFSGKIGSLHIERNAVDSAGKGREVGLKIAGFNKAAVGDYVECVKFPSAASPGWSPKPGVVRIQ